MSKADRGLPKTFDIKVSKGPVELGDYLDDPPPAPRLSPPPAPALPAQPLPVPADPPPTVTAQPPASSPAPIPVAPAPVVQRPVWTPAPSVAPEPAPAPQRQNEPTTRPSTRGKQRQFNMAPEALRMLEEVLVYLRANSTERDLRASEVMHGLVLALHSAVPHMDLSQIPPRGKWGSPTAVALPFALKQVFERAFKRV